MTTFVWWRLELHSILREKKSLDIWLLFCSFWRSFFSYGKYLKNLFHHDDSWPKILLLTVFWGLLLHSDDGLWIGPFCSIFHWPSSLSFCYKMLFGLSKIVVKNLLEHPVSYKTCWDILHSRKNYQFFGHEKKSFSKWDWTRDF